MPCLKVFTNLPKSKIPSDFVTKIIPVLAESVKKMPDQFTCFVSADCQLSVANDPSSPGVVATLESIGNLGTSENQYITQKLTAFIEKELGVLPKRFILTFYDLKSQDVAIDGSTVAFK